MRSFLKFGGISGLGWLLDFTILMLLVRAGFPAIAGNFISSSVAATCVFLVSRHLVFDKAEGGLPTRVLAYLLYTLMVITLASLAIGPVISGIGWVAEEIGRPLSHGAAAALGKIAITPPQLALNFVVARFMAQKTAKGSHGR